MTNKSWTLTVDDDGVITFPEDLLEVTGWREGDTLRWIDNKDGSWNLVKVDKQVLTDEEIEDLENKNQGC
jgi:bifunctional DNA-binding transcriptional regulator/antitoxin component of YhaV-PrlF toxin-antitoxin module